MKSKGKAILMGVITVIVMFTILGLSIIYLSEGYFVIVLISIFVLAGILQDYLTSRYGDKKNDKNNMRP